MANNVLAVLVYYNWEEAENAVRVILVDSEDIAKEFIQKDYEREVAEDKANHNSFDSEISEDGLEATITNYRRSGFTDVTKWCVIDVEDMRQIGGQ